MEAKPSSALLFCLSALLFFYTALCTPPEYQTLVINPLPLPSALSWTESDSETETATLGRDPDSVNLQLHHIDALSVNSTPQDLFNLRLQRDASRVKSITSLAAAAAAAAEGGGAVNRSGVRGKGFSSSVISGLAQGSGEYFTRLGVGTPPRYVYMVLDTGSDVVWLQCAPCKKCYSQADAIFDPSKSKSFARVPCRSLLCRKLDTPGCSSRTQTCLYQVSYGDGSFTVGEFSTETLTFRGSSVGGVALGCGHDNEGLFVGAAGLLGLGRGRLSFPSQTGGQFGRKFSYCLVDRSASSRPSSMVFGDAAISQAARFTPLLSNPKLDTFYYVELLGFSIGGTRVPGITASLFKLDPTGEGGVIIDSGTSVTRLTAPAYTALRNAFRVRASNLKPAAEFSLFDTCYDLTGIKEVKVPTVVLHFRGADMSLPASNFLIPVDTSGTFCFAFADTTSGLSIIGNIQQQSFRVVYDLAGSRVGFSPRGCA